MQKRHGPSQAIPDTSPFCFLSGPKMIESAFSVSPGKHEEEQEQVVSLLSGSKEPNICAFTPKFSGG